MTVLMSVASPGLLCCYKNASEQVQSVRLVREFEVQQERIVFPQHKFLFEASEETELEVTTSRAGVLLTERVPCKQLQVFTSI